MDKESIQEISQKLSDVMPGKCLMVRYSAGRREPDSEYTEQDLPSDARIKIITYELYPGIEISYNYFSADRFHFHHCHRTSALAIDHCCRGRIGWEMGDGLSLYFGSGDLSFHMNTKCSDSVITLPLGYYEGLSLSLDMDILEEHSPELIREAGIDIRKLCLKFCGKKNVAALPASSHIEHIFSEVYNLPEKMILPYLKLKCQELLLFLEMTEPAETCSLDPYHSGQTEIIRRIHDRITEDLRRRYTIDELSRQYTINTAALKAVFKSVYGLPIASYMKHYRISRAAQLLRETDESISSISASVGYESQSKFSKAFKDVMNILPTDYRKKMLVNQTLTRE